MGNLRYAIILFALVLATTLSAGNTASARLGKLYATFIAPCCWSRNLLEHHSPVAAEMRGQIDRMVQAGRSDDEIKSVFVAKYGARVLALPEGAPRVWLFWTPVGAAAAG